MKEILCHPLVWFLSGLLILVKLYDAIDRRIKRRRYYGRNWRKMAPTLKQMRRRRSEEDYFD